LRLPSPKPPIPGFIPLPRRDLKSQPEERNPFYDRGFPVQNMDGCADPAGIPQLVEIDMIAGDENRGDGDCAEQINRVAQTDTLGRKVAGTHHDVSVLRGHNDVPCGVSVAMKVTEGQNPHEPRFPFISGSASR
jgi:hypothetical protein